MKMGRLAAVAAGLMAVALSVSASHAVTYSTRTEAIKYTNATGDVAGAPGFDCYGSDPDFGGVGLVCYDVAPGTSVGNDVSVQINIKDDINPRKAGGYYEFRTSGSADTAISSGSFCENSPTLAIPPAATWMGVWLDVALGPLDCPVAQLGVAIQGTVTATITSIASL